MDRIELWHSRGFRVGLCVLLVLAIILGLCGPGFGFTAALPESPLKDTQISDIHLLQIGENFTDQNRCEMPEGDSREPPETEPEETRQEETRPEETLPDEPDQETPDVGDGDEGQEDGSQGEEGGGEAEPELAMVMTWYKYGTQPKTIVCGPSEQVAKTLNTAQLIDCELKYNFSLTGEAAKNTQITGVLVKEGDGEYRELSGNGTVTISLPEANSQRDYIFQVNVHLKERDAQGNPVEQDITFTYVLHCRNALDLEMELSWRKKDDDTGVITCYANGTAARTVISSELTENVFSYTPKLVGALAEDAQIVRAEYTTASGESGVLNPDGGALILQAADGTDEEIYYLTFEAQRMDEEGDLQTVLYRFTIVYKNAQDVQLSFVWLERGAVRRTMTCHSGESVSESIRHNQLSAGAVKYEISLTGADSEAARILNISYVSDAAGGGKLKESGSLPMTLPEGYVFNTYTVTVVVLAAGQQLKYEIVLVYSMDVSVQMNYSVQKDGAQENRTVVCENGKSKTAEAVYDDQLTDGMLSYTLSVVGADVSDLEITSVSCYQSGSGRTIKLGSSDDLQLLLKDGKTGENAFTITAEDSGGTVYEFRINIPYKHRGENTVTIVANLTDGQVVTNETVTNLSVRAWSEDGAGNVVSYIPANGTDTKLVVTLDGEEIPYASSSGTASEYALYPANPETGDTNTHTLRIYAEDAYGNYGELVLTLKGQRNQAGQKKGTATIYIDMTSVGLGVVGSVSYDVLADEPISYAVAKAVMGKDTGDPFGAADNALGWGGRYSGTLDDGFYLESLTAGLHGSVLGGSSWNEYGGTEEEILQSIDSYFGKGTALATLWRCIYRNGLNKSGGSGGAYGEFDYTSGSGWLFSLDGTYFPGQSMSDYYLEDGDVLTLRYTLAYGWDVGGGTAGYGNTAGYCVTALNGSYYINHRMETVEQADGSVCFVCRCCGLMEDCAHTQMTCTDLEDGTHIAYCEDCKTTIGDPQEHSWSGSEDGHSCAECGAAEVHSWKEVADSNTATCTEAGVRTVYCTVCSMVKEEESPARGHALNNRWNHTATEHYQKCSACGETIEESCGAHRYRYDAGDDDWYCEVCDAGHDWDYCGNAHLVIQYMTCQEIVFLCGKCGLQLTKEGDFPEYHAYMDGCCTHCGAQDPNGAPPETEPPETEPPETEPPVTEPPETDPPETTPPETNPPETTPPETEPPTTDPPEEGSPDE